MFQRIAATGLVALALCAAPASAKHHAGEAPEAGRGKKQVAAPAKKKADGKAKHVEPGDDRGRGRHAEPGDNRGGGRAKDDGPNHK